MYQKVLKHVEESYAHTSTWNPLLCSCMTIDFNGLFDLCNADLVSLAVIPRPEMQRPGFCVCHFELFTFLHTVLLSAFLCHLQHKLLIPTFQVTDSLSSSSCHPSLPYQEVNSFYDASFHLPLDHQINSSQPSSMLLLTHWRCCRQYFWATSI